MARNKEEKLTEAIVTLADEQLGGERSRTAGALFSDIADECRSQGHPKMERIMRNVAHHYLYD
ncbi:MAG TPA: hypothetical protein VJP02_01105 [Candidatus Sulfotelmatobacter sp.]|nr:hypothetical protein [Candidatus Sulfotelmatobacter sp.]